MRQQGGTVSKWIRNGVPVACCLSLAGVPAGFGATVQINSPQAAGFLQTPPRIVDDTFAPANTIAAADLDGDGHLDLVAGSSSSLGVAWWSNPDGTFSNPVKQVVDGGVSGIRSIRTFDFDHDGDLDITAVSWTGNAVYLWINEAGDGSTWTRRIVGDDLIWCSSVAPGDVDGDGYPDLVVTTEFYNDIVWFRNPGAVEFPWEYGQIGALSKATSSDVGDFDADGDLDVVVAGNWANAVMWYENRVTQGLVWVERQIASLDRPTFVRVVDINQDGKDDILGAADSAPGLQWWLNTGNPTNWPRQVIATNSGMYEAQVAHLDQDGILDVAGTIPGSGEILWWRGVDASGTGWVARPLVSRFTQAAGLATADMNEDGTNELVIAAASTYGVAMVEHIGDQRIDFGPGSAGFAVEPGRPQEVVLAAEVVNVGNGTQSVARTWSRTGDTTHQGAGIRTDRFVVTQQMDIVFAWTQQVWLGFSANGPGRIAGTQGWYDVHAEVGLTALPDATGFFDGWSGDTDGAPALVPSLSVTMDRARQLAAAFDWRMVELTITNAHSATVLARPARQFLDAPLPDQSGVIAVADVNLDGEPDLVGHVTGSGLVWWPGVPGPALFGSMQVLDAGAAEPRHLIAADLDVDGDPDLLAVHNAIVWHRNLDAGATWTAQHLSSGFNGQSPVVVADMDGDLWPDVVGAMNTATIVWLRNPRAPAATWTTNQIGIFSPNQGFIEHVAVADVSGDGVPDVLAGRYSSQLFLSQGGLAWSPMALAGIQYKGQFADLDTDGDQDILIRSSAFTGTWLENTDGSGSNWSTRSYASFPNSTYLSDAIAADVDADGDLDVITVEKQSPSVSGALPGFRISLNDDGAGGRWVSDKYAAGGQFVSLYGVADVDGDGALDILGAFGSSYFTPVTNRWMMNGVFADDIFLPPVDRRTVRANPGMLVYSFDRERTQGATQHVLAGWTFAGGGTLGGASRIASGLPVLTNSALSYAWRTNYWLAVSAGVGGAVAPTSRWAGAGSTVTVEAVASSHFRFVQWTGDTAALPDPATNPAQALVVVQPLTLAAVFDPEMAGQGVPWWWLAAHGMTQNVDVALWSDDDGDGALVWEEYAADTDPTNTASVLMLGLVDKPSDGTIELGWRGGTGAWQIVEMRSGDGDSTWQPVFTNTPPTAVQQHQTVPTGGQPMPWFRIRAYR